MPNDHKKRSSSRIIYFLLVVFLLFTLILSFIIFSGEPEPAITSVNNRSGTLLKPFGNFADEEESEKPDDAGASETPSYSMNSPITENPDETVNNQPDTNSEKIPPYLLANKRSVTPREDFINPIWSPDGLDILVTKSKYRGLYLVSVTGGGMRQLSDGMGDGYAVSWSLNGSKIIIDKDGNKKILDLSGEEITDDVETPEEMAYSDGADIIIRNPENGEELKITDGGDSYYDPSLSPGGSKVAYEGLTTGLKIKDMETGEVTDIGQGSNAQWTPDGEGLVYQYTQDDGHQIISGDIYYADVNTGEVFNITDTPDIIELNPRISPDGRYIIYEVDGQIFIADLIENSY